jgi:hypothetical protein
VIECVPTVRVVVANVATPEPFSRPLPIVVAPSRKFTEPVGVPAPGETAATVAVNVTDAPDVLGFRLEVSPVVVLAWFTT